MAMNLIETTVYDALKLLIALTVVICISIVIMSMKQKDLGIGEKAVV